jgi:hypothetical protein
MGLFCYRLPGCRKIFLCGGFLFLISLRQYRERQYSDGYLLSCVVLMPMKGGTSYKIKELPPTH